MRTMLFLFLVCFTVTSVFSQDSKRPTNLNAKSATGVNAKSDLQQKKDSLAKTIYTCPMHSEVLQDKAGKCPECKMNLVKKDMVKNKYTCPMHGEIVQDKPGKCPKCKMDLKVTQPAAKSAPKTAS